MSLFDHTTLQPTDWKCPASVIKSPFFDPDHMTLEVLLNRFSKFCSDSKMPSSLRAAQLLDFVSESINNEMFEARLTQTPMWKDVHDYLTQSYGCKKSRSEWEADFLAATRATGEPIPRFAERLKLLACKANIPVSEEFLVSRILETKSTASWVEWLQLQMDEKDPNWEEVVAAACKCELLEQRNGKTAVASKHRFISNVATTVEDCPGASCICADAHNALFAQLTSLSTQLDQLQCSLRVPPLTAKVNKADASPSNQCWTGGKAMSKRQMSNEVIRTQLTAPLQPLSQQTSAGEPVKRFRCGSFGHIGRGCGAVCSTCGRRGYVAPYCKSSVSTVQQEPGYYTQP